MGALFIGRGDCRLGTTKRDKAGNVVEQTGAKWEPNAEGGCVAICDMDPDKMEPVGAAEVFGDWDAAHFLARVLDKLGPGRPTNIPDFRDILKKAMADGESPVGGLAGLLPGDFLLAYLFKMYLTKHCFRI